MRRAWLLSALVLLAALVVACAAAGAAGGRAEVPLGPSSGPSDSLAVFERQRGRPLEAQEVVPGELIVGFASSAPPSRRAAAFERSGASLARDLLLPGYSLVRVPPGREEEFTARLLTEPGVETVEPNLLRQLFFDPNDEYYSWQWNLPKIGLPAAWDKTTGVGVTVAVIDSGVAYEDCPAATCGADYFKAPDFEGATFVSPWDFVDNDAHPNDEDGHGTHVASTIAEATNNTIGGAGVAPDASIMLVKVVGPSGAAIADEVDGIMWATDNGADIINLSLGAFLPASAELDAVNYAMSNGVVVVAATGNDGSPLIDCPACYPGVFAVGATRIDQTLALYSNYGLGVDEQAIILVAPGGDASVDQDLDGRPDFVFQQTFGHSCPSPTPIDFSAFFFCGKEGTSMAAPHVAGVAALVLSINPNLTPVDVWDIMTSTATDLGSAGYDFLYGYGLINAAAAVAAAQATLPTPTPAPTNTPPPTPTATPVPTAVPTATAIPGGGMSLNGPTTVSVGKLFTLSVSADPAPDVEIGAFGSEVLFPDGLKWQQRATCADEVLPRPLVGGPLALCEAGLSALLGGARHAVISSISLPIEPLDVTVGGVNTLVELDFVCNTPGSYKLTLTALPDSDDGALFSGTDAREIRVGTIQQDYDGDTVPNDVADTITIDCVEHFDSDSDGCTNEQELGTNRLFGGQRNPLDFWDFFDPNRDGSVSLPDFLAVLARFGAVGDATIDPLSPPPPAPAYHTRFDRTGASPGANPWQSGPPDGVIAIGDFLALLTQFGHTCA